MGDNENKGSDLSSLSAPRLPKTYESAKLALSECERLDEVKTWADKALALAAYAAQAQDEELEVLSRRIRNRAVRRMGQIILEVEPASNQYGKSGTSGAESTSRKEAATVAGISERQRYDAQAVAKITEGTFEELNEHQRPATLSQLVDVGRGKSADRKPSQMKSGEAFTRDLCRLQSRLANWNEVVPFLDGSQRKRAQRAASSIQATLSRIKW